MTHDVYIAAGVLVGCLLLIAGACLGREGG